MNVKYLYYLVGLPHILVYLLYSNRIKEIEEDLARFLPPYGSSVEMFVSALSKKEYRSVFYKRLPFACRHILNVILPRERTCFLNTGCIGGGLHVQHGFSTIVVAEKIGKNFSVYQNVTVGWEKTGKPTIGDNVTIYAGAVVSGGINIGNNVRICANAHVRQNVPDNCIVYGNPCVIKRL